jgi:hypothetical protein
VADPFTPTVLPGLRRFYRIGLAAHFTLIALIDAGAYLGLIPTKITVVPHYDLFMHFLLVGMFGFFLDGALLHRPIVRVPFFPRLGPMIALGLAATEEFLQRLSPRRSSSWSDFAANASGILFCAWLATRLTLSNSARHAALGPTERDA